MEFLHKMCEGMLATKDELPHYVERLESLKSVHNECSQVFTKLRDL